MINLGNIEILKSKYFADYTLKTNQVNLNDMNEKIKLKFP